MIVNIMAIIAMDEENKEQREGARGFSRHIIFS